VKRRLAAILAADVVGYTALMGADETGTLQRLTDLRHEIIEPLIDEHHGRVVKLMGDGLLVEFASVVDAVACALAWQDGVAEQEADAGEGKRLLFRIGINVGDVIVEGDDIHGDGVNIAARLEGQAEPGGICLSGDAYRQVKGKLEADFEDLGEHDLKNVAEPVRIYRIAADRSGTVVTSAAKEPLPLPDKPSIAVLPFTNMSGDPEQEYFCDGMAEDIITELCRFGELFVIARNSSFVYREQVVNVRQVGQELGVRYVLEGSVRRAGRRVRVTAQLADTTTGDHLWAERYDRDLDDIFAVQDEVTRVIVGTLTERIKHVGAEHARRTPTEELAAYDYVLRGRELLHRWNSEDNRKAREMFEAAVALDPDYAMAHAYLADAYYADWIGGWSQSPRDALERFCSLAEKSLSLDDTMSAAHEATARAHLYRRRYDEARFHAEKALSLCPNDADNVMQAGYIAMFDGEHARAIDLINQAARLNPFGRYGIALGMALFSAKRYEEAIGSLKTARGRIPHVHAFLAASYAHAGMDAKARGAASQLIEIAQSETAKVDASTPDNWMAFLAEKFPYRDQADLDHLLVGLRMAGVPD
jgi:adenylate cyclase